MCEIVVDVVFVGLCINGCIEDLWVVVEVLCGCKVVDGVWMLIVLGLMWVCVQVEVEGFGEIFIDVGV